MLVIVATGCLNEPAYTGTAGLRVAIAGDSIIESSAGALHTALDPGHLVRMVGSGTSTFVQASGAGATLGATNPDAVVAEFGTYDAVNTAPVADTITAMDALIAKFPKSEWAGKAKPRLEAAKQNAKK